MNPSNGPQRQAISSAERASRIFLFLAGGLLLSILVSCACGPVR